MGFQLAMHKYFAVFLALAAWHGSLLTHGRKIKPLMTDTIGQGGNPNPTTLKVPLINVPSLSSDQNKKVESQVPVIPKYGVIAASFGDSGADKNAFRPTTPGNSPGVGHRKFAVEDKDMVVQSPDVKVSVTEGSENGIGPGHSPGVGHRQQN